MVMPGCACTNESAWAARVPLPLRRPALRLPPRLAGAAGVAVAAAAAGAAFVVRVLEPLGRPGPRRPGTLRATGAAEDPLAAAADPPTPSSAEAAASKRWYSSTSGFSSLSRAVISWRFSSRKSVTIESCSLGLTWSALHGYRGYLTTTTGHIPACKPDVTWC